MDNKKIRAIHNILLAAISAEINEPIKGKYNGYIYQGDTYQRIYPCTISSLLFQPATTSDHRHPFAHRSALHAGPRGRVVGALNKHERTTAGAALRVYIHINMCY